MLGVKGRQHCPTITNSLVFNDLNRGVEGHWNHPYGRPWATVDELVKEPLAHLVGN